MPDDAVANLLREALAEQRALHAEVVEIRTRQEEYNNQQKRLLEQVFGNGGTSIRDRLTRLDNLLEGVSRDHISECVKQVNESRSQRSTWTEKVIGGLVHVPVTLLTAWLLFRFFGKAP